MTASPDDLDRFVSAQDPVYATACRELADGRKRSHWMWFVFPQLRGLGRSGTAQFYGLASRAEAEAYLAHPVLGARLRAVVELTLGVAGRSAHEIFGSPDDLKLRSSLTLFDAIEPDGVFARGLQRFYDGEADEATLRLLAG